MLQKVIKVGNSLAIVLPSKFTRETKIKAGQQVLVLPDKESKKVIVTTNLNDASANDPMDIEFFNWLETQKKQSADLIRAMAKV